MAKQVHVARLGLYTVDGSGNRVDKSGTSASINTMKSTSMDFLVIPDTSIPNSAGYPTIKTYLEDEANDNFELSHLDQSYIITYKNT